MSLPPVAVFAYNRPKHLELCLSALGRSMDYMGKELPVKIFCDGPRERQDELKVQETIATARKWGRGEVIVRDKNRGYHNLTEGITSLCTTYGEMIAVEDDVIVSPDFLPFMCRGLDGYRDEPQVFQISGFMYHKAQPPKPELFFLSHPFIWGWATWKRAWDHFEWNPSDTEQFFRRKQVRRRYNFFGSIFFSEMLKRTLRGEVCTWDAQWMYAVYRAKGLVLYPHRSLVWNCGSGGGTHGKQRDQDPLDQDPRDQDPRLAAREEYIHGDLQLEDFERPQLERVSFPKKIACDERAMRNLALVFLKERFRRERKQPLRMVRKILYQKLRAALAKRP